MSDDPRQLQNAMALGQQPDIFRLNVDCFEELFDWLPLVDLHSISQTCTRLQRYAGHVFRETYPGAHVECKNGGIFIGDLRVDGFCDSIENLSLREDNLECFRFIKSNRFKSLKRIEFEKISFNDEKIACIKHILTKGAAEQLAIIEDIQLTYCEIKGEFFDDILQYCPNIKRLSLTTSEYRNDGMDVDDDYHPLIGIDNNWMLRKYPKLEYFALGGIFNFYHRKDELGTLFKENPNIRKFAVDPSFFSVHLVANMGFEVDDLAIICDDFESHMYYCMYETLAKKKFFKQLQLYNIRYLPENFEDLEQMQGIDGLEKLHICPHVRFFPLRDLMCMQNLKTLCIHDLDRSSNALFQQENPREDIDGMCKLTQLNNVFIEKATPVQMDALISHLPNLKIFTVTQIEADDGNADIDLMKWNRERKRLVGARKIRVYVPEAIYLQVKWTTHETNYKLVELKRLESHDWDHDFAYPQRRYYLVFCHHKYNNGRSEFKIQNSLDIK